MKTNYQYTSSWEAMFHFKSWKFASGIEAAAGTVIHWRQWGPFELRRELKPFANTVPTTGNCNQTSRTADGVAFGKCLRPLINGICSVHGKQA